MGQIILKAVKASAMRKAREWLPILDGRGGRENFKDALKLLPPIEAARIVVDGFKAGQLTSDDFCFYLCLSMNAEHTIEALGKLTETDPQITKDVFDTVLELRQGNDREAIRKIMDGLEKYPDMAAMIFDAIFKEKNLTPERIADYLNDFYGGDEGLAGKVAKKMDDELLGLSPKKKVMSPKKKRPIEYVLDCEPQKDVIDPDPYV
ncbi:MAG: hypothetical protein ABIA67_05340 [Candidatus Margulisiibacteriota bacterium]